jgi:hypothetical protein
MVDSIHGELRKPSAARAQTGGTAAEIKGTKQTHSVEKGKKSAPIGAKNQQSGVEDGRVSL